MGQPSVNVPVHTEQCSIIAYISLLLILPQFNLLFVFSLARSDMTVITDNTVRTLKEF